MSDTPLKSFMIQFPYKVQYSLPNDEKTEVIILTNSEQMYYAKTKEDALKQHECFMRDSSDSLRRYISDEVTRSLRKISEEENIEYCNVSETGTPEVREYSEGDLINYRRDVLLNHYRKKDE